MFMIVALNEKISPLMALSTFGDHVRFVTIRSGPLTFIEKGLVSELFFSFVSRI